MHSMFEYYGVFQGILALYLTNKCNLSCRHCGVNSGPKESSRLKIDKVLEQLPALAAKGKLKAVHISGGEPFLYREDLRRIAALSNQLGLLVGVNTNAFWAPTEDAASSLLETMPGLGQLLLSTDKYHKEFLPLENVANAARAGVTLGLTIQISICQSPVEETGILNELEELLGAATMEKISMGTSRLDLSGRAMMLPEAHWRGVSPDYPVGPCHQLNRPVVLEDGSVFACCNTTVSARCSNSPLNLGNIADTPLSEVLSRADHDDTIQALRAFGPKFLAETLDEDCVGELRGSYLRDDICSLCSDLMSRPKIVAAISRNLNAPDCKEVIKAGRAVILGEIDSLIAP